MSNSDSPLKLRAVLMFPTIIALYCCLFLMAAYKPALDSPPSKALSLFIVLLEPGAMPACMKHLNRDLAEALKKHEHAHAFKLELHSSHCGLWP